MKRRPFLCLVIHFYYNLFPLLRPCTCLNGFWTKCWCRKQIINKMHTLHRFVIMLKIARCTVYIHYLSSSDYITWISCRRFKNILALRSITSPTDMNKPQTNLIYIEPIWMSPAFDYTKMNFVNIIVYNKHFYVVFFFGNKYNRCKSAQICSRYQK